MTATTVVEVSIEESKILVEMEIGVPDLLAFGNLLPDEIRAGIGLEAEPLSERLVRFFREDFVIRADGGPPLPGRVTDIELRRRVPRDELTGEPLPATEGESEPVVFVVLEYDFSGHPDTLTFHPPTSGGAFPTANIGFITYHMGLPVMDFRYLGAESTIDLDWDDPWFSKFRNRNLWRQYDSPMNVFLYVEPYEVRVEIIARPRDVQRWEDVGVGGLKAIPVEIQEDVKRRVADFFADNLDLTIDGEAIRPVLDRVNFLERTLRTSTVINPPRELDAASATLGVIFLQPTTGYPQEAKVTWNLFPERVARIPGATTRSATVTDQRAEEIVSALLHNVYRAFDFRDEETIYDTLAHSVTGDLLTRTYIETRRGLELASQGGARAKVQEIEMLEVDAEREGTGFRATCTWNVAASVGHWGHIHQRRNQYVAELTIEPVDGVWKITGLELIEEQRL